MSVIKNKGFRIFLYILGYVSAVALIVSIIVTTVRYSMYDRELESTSAFAETSQIRDRVYDELNYVLNKAKYTQEWDKYGLDDYKLKVFDYATGEYMDVVLSEESQKEGYVSGVQTGLINASYERDYDYYDSEMAVPAEINKNITFDPKGTGFLKIKAADFIGLMFGNAVIYDEERLDLYLEDPDSVTEKDKENYEKLVPFLSNLNLENGDYFRVLENGLILYSQFNNSIYTSMQGRIFLNDGPSDFYIALPKKTVEMLEVEELSGNGELLEKVFSGYIYKSPFLAAYAILTNPERSLVSDIRYLNAAHRQSANTAYSFDGSEIADSVIYDPTGILTDGNRTTLNEKYPELVEKIRNNSDVFVCYDKQNGTLEQWYKEKKGTAQTYPYIENLQDYTSISDESFVLGINLYSGYTDYYYIDELAYNACKMIPYPAVILIISALVFLFCVIALMIGEPVRLKPWDKIPYEIFAAGYVVIMFVLIRILAVGVLSNTRWLTGIEKPAAFLLACLFILVLYILTASLFMTTLRRIRCKEFLNSFLVVKLFRWIGKKAAKGCRSIANEYNTRLKGKTKLLIFAGILVAVNAIALLILGCFINEGMILCLILIATDVFAVWKLLKYSVEVEKLLEVSRQIEAGDLDAKIDTDDLKYNTKELGESLNHLGDGLSRAVETSIRDERTKAELITNVSHDIKTPLTSIINYVDLLKKENIENEKAQEYIEVLDRKSQRLKQLILDLIEVSKTNTGNIELERMNLNLAELLNQCLGEYEEKMAAENLEIVRNTQIEDAVIYADGRRIFRIIDNIFNNVVKYSQPGTRVYVDLKPMESANGKRVALSVKNVSREMLNVSADELMERFVRGDRSRHTEGSGLGLSIAKNLTELQDGTFDINIDGDLFKVDVTFPMVG